MPSCWCSIAPARLAATTCSSLPPQGLGLQVLAEVTGCQTVKGGYEIGTSFIDLEDAQRQLLARHVLRQQARVRRADRGDEA